MPAAAARAFERKLLDSFDFFLNATNNGGSRFATRGCGGCGGDLFFRRMEEEEEEGAELFRLPADCSVSVLVR